MKKKNYILLCLLLIAVNCKGQTNSISENKNPKPLYLVKFYSKSSIVTQNAFISPVDKDTTYALSPIQYKEIQSLLNVDRLLFIRVKRSAILFTLNDLFRAYNIQEKYRRLAIKVNYKLISNPETILISQSAIIKVLVLKDSKGQYINVIEKGYYENENDYKKRKKKGEVFVQ